MNSTPNKIGSEYEVATSLEYESTFSFSPEIISQITEYFRGRIIRDINDMTGHILNTLNSSRAQTIPSEDLCSDLEKYKYIIKIQQSAIQITNLITNNGHLD